MPNFASEEPVVLNFTPGDLLVLTTDGFFEWEDSNNEQFGVKRLEDAVRASKELPPAEIIATLYRTVLEFAGGTKQSDDLTAVVIKGK